MGNYTCKAFGLIFNAFTIFLENFAILGLGGLAFGGGIKFFILFWRLPYWQVSMSVRGVQAWDRVPLPIKDHFGSHYTSSVVCQYYILGLTLSSASLVHLPFFLQILIPWGAIHYATFRDGARTINTFCRKTVVLSGIKEDDESLNMKTKEILLSKFCMSAGFCFQWMKTK